MKKNKMMRLASVLLVLTLLTTGIIGGTLAKYVTSDSGTDTARVAKFGVVATVSGDLFGSTYAKADENTIVSVSTADATVNADSTTDKVVAPGTKNEKGLTLSVTGTPEVSTKVTLGEAENNAKQKYTNSDIYLAAGDYGVMVEYKGEKTAENISNYYTYDGTTKTYTKATNKNDTVYELRDGVSVDADYYPLTWKVDTTAGTLENVITELKKKFHGTEDNGNAKGCGTYKPNELINDLSAKVTWEWKFEDDGADKTVRDAKDTILGDMIAANDPSTSIAVVAKSKDKYVKVTYQEEKVVADSANEVVNAYANTEKVACLTASFGASLTVEQVD